MNTTINYDTPLVTLTVGQLLEQLSSASLPNTHPSTQYVYSWKELARALGCSSTKLYQIRRTGIFEDAIQRNGRNVIIDVPKAILAYGSAGRESGRR